MDLKEYKNVFENEESHFYYVANHKIILSLVKNYLTNTKRIKSILDAGCGTGFLAKKLEKHGKVFAIDISPHAIKFAKRRKIRPKLASVTKIPFKDNHFDLLVSIDVLYHKRVDDDEKALKEFYRVLKPGGILILRLPAYKWLKLAHDKIVHTRARYEKNELRDKLSGSGFDIEKLSYTNSVLLPLALLSPKSTIKRMPNFLNSLLIRALSLESYILPKFDLPFGLGLIAVSRKHY